jgi:hypothetical protein
MQPDAYTGQMRLVDAALQRDHGATIEDWLRLRRDRGDSYETIARELTHLIDVEGFSLSFKTARVWCQRLGIVEATEPATS